MMRLWTRMVQIYGHRWLSAYGDVTEEGVMSETAKTWQKALRGVTYAQIAKGLAKCLERGNSRPPSLPEFRAMCLGKNHTEQPKQNAAAYRAPECLKLVRPKGNSEVARAHLQAMRRLIIGGRVTAKPAKASAREPVEPIQKTAEIADTERGLPDTAKVRILSQAALMKLAHEITRKTLKKYGGGDYRVTLGASLRWLHQLKKLALELPQRMSRKEHCLPRRLPVCAYPAPTHQPYNGLKH